MTRHNRHWKESELDQIRALIKKNNVIAVIDLSSFPASLFGRLRKKLAGKATFKVSKIRVIKKAFEGMGQKESLSNFIGKSCGLIFSSMDPFELYGFLKRNKGNVPAKAGKVAEDDIVITARDTGLPPGPALSDLKAAGLEVRVQGQTIAIAKDKVVTKKGEVISKAVAGTLSKLDIKPVKIGLKLVAVIDRGQIFESKVLDIDTEKMFEDFAKAYTGALNLAFNSGFPTVQTTPLLIQKAFREAKSVALEFNLFDPSAMPEILAKAVRQANTIAHKIPKTAAVPKQTVENA